ncbi:B12-binding domain-containing radical SAM protein [Candidatus Nitrospira salsa]|nr:MAG: hypothetical protein NPIRA01_06700 [Nitrospirales bacterium]
MKVVLVYPTWTGSYGIFGHFARRAAGWPPLNLALLAAIAENHGHEVSIIDGEANGLSMDEMVAATMEQQPDIVGLTATSPFFHISKAFATHFKQTAPEIPVVIGGPHITIVKEKALESCFDWLFIGEAEDSWPQFLDLLEAGRDVSEVPGLIFHRDNQVITTGQPANVSDLDSLPFPGRHLLDMSKYKIGTLEGRKNFSSIQTMRGCPWKCIFCASEALKTTDMRVRSPRSVVAEMKSVVTKYGITHFNIVDDVLTLWNDHIVEICDLLDQEGLSITFEGSTRANLVDEALIERLAKSGLIRLSFGLETVDAQMRKTMKKQVPLEHYVRANRICNQFGVEALNSVMIGLPGETRETVKKTLDFLGKARDVAQANFAIAVPYPGTEFHDMAISGDYGIELMSKDFSEYRRYGSAVTTVNGLSPHDLIELQNEGFVKIYSAPWRWRPMLKKHGVLGGLLMLFRVGKLLMKKSLPRNFTETKQEFVSLGDGAFGKVQDVPNIDMASMEPELVGIATEGSPDAPLLTIQSLPRKSPAPAGHIGHPSRPNLL